MENSDVQKILVDQGSFVDIIYIEILQVFKIEERDLTPYKAYDLSGFDD